MKKVACALFGFTAFAGQAVAADMPVRVAKAPPAPVVAVANWTGCYVGGHAGGAWSHSRYTFDNGAGLVEDFAHDPNSWIAGGQLGCQFQFAGSWVLGAEGTWSATDLSSTNLSVIAPPRTRTLSIDRIATATAKLGYTWGPWMLYGKGGFADARIETFAINPATGVFTDARNWQTGWTAGIGVDYLVTPNFVLGAEFDYYRFGFNRTQPNSDGTVGNYFNTRSNVYAVMGRASWLFNFGGPVVAKY